MTASSGPRDPATFAAAAAALDKINEAVHTVRTAGTETRPQAAQVSAAQVSADQALAALLLLRELRDQLAEWEPGLIEAARDAGSSWADLAHPLGVASRQAAEKRYLRVRPGAPGATGEQRVSATRSRRAADRTVTAWARTNAADLRQLAGQITALTDLPAPAGVPLARLAEALSDNDAANLIGPLADTHTYLKVGHPEFAARIDTITHNADRLRRSHGDPG